MKKAIYFDMDGTVADLYGEKNWLADLRANNPRPYENAKPLVDVEALKAVLAKHKANGTAIGVITWLAKDADKAYDKAVRKAKREWLDRHFGKRYFDKVHMVKFGTPKHKVATIKDAILVDDNAEVRAKWNLGTAYDVDNILADLA